MHEIELKIARRDWLIIAAFGIVFSVAITAVVYFLLQKPLADGMIFAGLLGSMIVGFSMLFISFLNTRILPFISHRYWVALAALFSFLSGFFGTLAAFLVARSCQITLLPRFVDHIFALAAVLGLLTYIIGALLYQFVKMSNQKDFQQKKLNESRLKSLETQLNPHFLFNALNSLAELIHQDRDKAETAVMELSSFLRTSMKESMLTTFEHEISNLKRYIRLENIRFSGAIVLRVNDGGINAQTPLPKFSVQLLVENALKHGFTSSDEHFVITVSAHTENNTTVISVQNSGKPVRQKNFGIGLNNLQERVRMLCRGSVRLESANPPTYILQIGECDEDIVSR